MTALKDQFGNASIIRILTQEYGTEWIVRRIYESAPMAADSALQKNIESVENFVEPEEGDDEIVHTLNHLLNDSVTFDQASFIRFKNNVFANGFRAGRKEEQERQERLW